MKKDRSFFSKDFKVILFTLFFVTIAAFYINYSNEGKPLYEALKIDYQLTTLAVGASLLLGSLVARFLYIHLTSKKVWLLRFIAISGFTFTFLFICTIFFIWGTYIGAFKKEVQIPEVELPVITEDDILQFINDSRFNQKIKGIKRNTALDEAAKLRAEAIINNQEWDSGLESNLTRETAVGNSYKYGTLGHLVGFIYAGQTPQEIYNFWKTDRSSRETVSEKTYVEVGIATKTAKIDGFDSIIISVILASKPVAKQAVYPTPQKQSYSQVAWGGPELWTSVNKRRVELGVNALKQRDELCTIAAIRLNQLLDLGNLDGHTGFVPTLERDDLKWINQKYTVNEFLIVGYPTPEEAVKGWEHTLGHRSLLAGGEHAFGCIYSQNTFGVAITGY